MAARSPSQSQSQSESGRLGVCLGYPALHGPEMVEALRALDPCIDVLPLPVDPGSGWLTASAGEPHPEPPPWATGVAAARRDALARAEVLVALQVSEELMTLAPRLRWIQSVGAGVEQFAAAGVSRDRVVVTNASGVSSASMAEYVLARILQHWKRLPEQEQLQREHRYVQTYGRSLAGSTLGIVGMGHIGKALATRARALGMQDLGLRRRVEPGATPDPAHELFTAEQLHAMLARCDAVVVAAPATPETRHLIDAKALAALPQGAFLVNVARGSLLDEAALIASLESGHLGGAALDVFEQEPLPPESPIWDAPRLLVSAHSSVSVDRYVQDVFACFVDNLERYLAGEPLVNRVDMDALGFR